MPTAQKGRKHSSTAKGSCSGLRRRKRKVKGYSQAVRWNPEITLRQLGVTKLAWQRAQTATGIKLANRKLCAAIRKRLLRRWKGTALEVRTLCGPEMEIVPRST